MRLAALLVLVAAAWAGPAHAQGRGTPPPGPARAGYHLYGQYCLACHGPNGAGVAGKGPSLRGVGARAADFYLETGYMPLPRDGVQPKRRSHLLLGAGQIDELVAYVAWLAPGPGIPPPPARGDLARGLRLFTESCAGCHQVVARGGFVNGAVAPALDRATPTQIAEAVRIGPYVMPRFTRAQLSDADVASIVRYVRYAAAPENRGGFGLGEIGPVPEGAVAWLVGLLGAVVACVLIGRRLRA